MRRNARSPRPEVLAPRRGNSIVLVMAILVLLVIIATAFITRTHAGRLTASVMQRTTLRDDNARATAEMLAYEIGAALFPFPVDPTLFGFDDPVNSNTPRLSQRPLDFNLDGVFDYFPLRYATDPTVPYGFAPYHVVAYTNWPDPLLADAPNWPSGPGNLHALAGTASLFLAFEGNPVGNPGFGDTRWLADHEPLRWITTGGEIAFSHWRHMTNIARPNNGFRICRDISDITNVNGFFGGIVENLSIPVEQWLAILPANVAAVTGDSSMAPFLGNDIFMGQWQSWFGPDYQLAYTISANQVLGIPANFYNLSNLNPGITPPHEWFINDVPQDRPESEFIPFTARHTVNRVLVDTDGDGFTDSFWFLAPTMTERGIRQIVAVRISDNSAMLDVNVATRFNRLNTTGATPSDLQLVGDITDGAYTGGLDVGYFDNPAHHETAPFELFGTTDIGYNPLMWAEWMTGPSDRALNYLQQIGVIDQGFNLNPNFSTQLNTALDRLTYWQLAGRRPLEPVGGLTPFGLTEEMELRISHGQNYPWIASRFEKVVQSNVANETGDWQFLHANLAREESSEYLDQLSNVELAFDHRRNLTMYSGARNDQMPPWLWWRWDLLPDDVLDQALMNPADLDGNGVADVIDRFLAQARRKLDLREEANPPLFDGERDFAYRLPRTLMLALTDGDQDFGNSYYGAYDVNDGLIVNALTHARRLAAGLAANILEFRDADSGYGFVQTSSVPLPRVGTWNQDLRQRFLGMEKQPFLVEALIGHVYKSDFTVPGGGDDPPPYTNNGNHMIYEESPNSTIVVVQIANPFDEVLNLNNFRLRVFPEGGDPHEVDFSTLPNPSIDPGEARTYYAIENELDGDPFHDPWVNVLQLDATFSQSVNVTEPASGISNERSVYDSGDEEHGIELVRRIDSNANGNIGTVAVLIDRIDISAPTVNEDFEFGESVEDLANTEPDSFPQVPPPPFDNPLQTFPGLDIGDNTYWIQWVHVSRDWDVNAVIQANERNPRYVFAARDVDPGAEPFATATTDDGDVVFTEFVGSDDIHFHESVKEADTGFSLNFSMQMLQKDADFEQVGELLNVWMFGHLLSFEPGQINTAYIETVQTFSEFMIDEDRAGEDVRANRLTIVPDVVDLGPAKVGEVVGMADPDDLHNPNYLLNPLHAVPAVPAAARVLDAFVCDTGLLNANGFTGKSTPGLINVNTAPPEVMRSAPHMARLVHELNTPSDNPSVRVPEAIVRYRERFGDPIGLNEILPIYGNRGGGANPPFFLGNPDLVNLRGERGFASLGELMLLMEPANFLLPPNLEPNDNWRIDFSGLMPFVDVANNVESTRISTDVNDLPGNNPDIVAEDAEELNLLYSGMSNMLTTRSDVFTVYFRVRSFIQNPTTGVWDATNPEFIVDDSRYVMLVDRSEVNQPNDKPKILYLEKLPK
ncbi:MAG: hypothetical protein V3T53_03635 [Phycisphaerales bacterium]